MRVMPLLLAKGSPVGAGDDVERGRMTVEMAGRVRSPVKPGMTVEEPGMTEMADQVGHDVERGRL